MKITEITEGYTNEGWGEFKSAAKAGYDAVANTAVGRSIGRGLTGIAAKAGSGRAQGAQKVQQATMGVMKNFQRYLGQTGSKPTLGALKQYMSALGIKDPVFEAVPSQAQIAQAKAKKDAGLAGSTVAGMKDTDVLDRNQLMKIIQNNIQNALKTGTLPKEIQKFLSS